MKALTFVSILSTCSEFIDKVLPQYAAENKQYQFKIIHKSLKNINPRMVISFSTGHKQTYSLEKKGTNEILSHIKKLEQRPLYLNPNQSRWATPISYAPSIQGVWSQETTKEFPYVFTDPKLNPNWGKE